jgi:ABC-type sugar transport system ATPase subunit
MSISDIIVVMKLGVVQQIGKPQDVYDNPANLFVAKFLGIPPINVLKGYVKGGQLYIDGKIVKEVKKDIKGSYIEASARIKEKIADYVSNINEEDAETVKGYLDANNVEALENSDYAQLATWMKQDQALNEQIAKNVFDVYVGIRPEGFNLSETGNFELELDKIEVMGRDISLICKNAASINPFVRAIISSDFKISEDTKTVKFDIKPHKIFIFDGITEERIYE